MVGCEKGRSPEASARRADKRKTVQIYIANRFCLRCPHCNKPGMNSKGAGGNERCFHCGECGFVECEWCSPAHET